jgi:hypothetical protein
VTTRASRANAARTITRRQCKSAPTENERKGRAGSHQRCAARWRVRQSSDTFVNSGRDRRPPYGGGHRTASFSAAAKALQHLTVRWRAFYSVIDVHYAVLTSSKQAVHAVGGALPERRGVSPASARAGGEPRGWERGPRLSGVRKLRWGVAGRGKRGGIRVIYYLRLRRGQVWMLTMYAKNEAATIPGPVLRRIKEEIDGFD